jgi:hypothetical protein
VIGGARRHERVEAAVVVLGQKHGRRHLDEAGAALTPRPALLYLSPRPTGLGRCSCQCLGRLEPVK